MADWIGLGSAYPLGEGWQDNFISPSASVTPVITVESYIGHQSGIFIPPQLSIQTVQSLSDFIGHQTGIFDSPQSITQPIILVENFLGHQVGIFVPDTLTIQPSIETGELIGIQVGLFLPISVVVQPTIKTYIFHGVREHIIENVLFYSPVKFTLECTSAINNYKILNSQITNKLNRNSVLGIEKENV